jgi:hypothetical protein
MLDLTKAIPGFSNPATRKQLMQSIDDYAVSIGFTQKEADSIKDPRIVLMAYQAMMYSKDNGEQGYAKGGQLRGIGDLGGYSDGGRLLRGPGDGVSDSIPASIGNKRPARLADGEFVVPSRIVSELGNGSTDAGARKLYAMLDRIQAGRKKTVGKGKVATNSRADKNLPA